MVAMPHALRRREGTAATAGAMLATMAVCGSRPASFVSAALRAPFADSPSVARVRGAGGTATSQGSAVLAGKSRSGTIPSATVSLVAAAAAGLCGLVTRRREHRQRASLLQVRAVKEQTRMDWYRKVKRLGNDLALFDVTIPKPMGVRIAKFPQRDGVGISEVFDDGNTDKLNRKVCLENADGMWVLEGDRIMAVNGEDCEDSSFEEVIELMQKSGEEVTMTLMRNTRKGPIKVVLMPKQDLVTVRRGAPLSSAAEYAAGKELTYGCLDGWCGTCWHRERFTNGVFKPCCDLLTGDWDNVMPLILTPKPEKAGDASYLEPRGM